MLGLLNYALVAYNGAPETLDPAIAVLDGLLVEGVVAPLTTQHLAAILLAGVAGQHALPSRGARPVDGRLSSTEVWALLVVQQLVCPGFPGLLPASRGDKEETVAGLLVDYSPCTVELVR